MVDDTWLSYKMKCDECVCKYKDIIYNYILKWINVFEIY